MSTGISWTFSTIPVQGGMASVSIKAPEFSEVWADDRRQRRVLSAAGELHVQDLGVEDRFLEAAWSSLDQRSWSGLRKVIRTAGHSARKITIAVSGTQRFMVGLATGVSINGKGLNTGDPVNTGDTVEATVFTLAGLRFDMSRTEFEQMRRRATAGVISLRFRLPAEPLVILAGS